jgi:predicted dehydrogenase
MAQLRVGLVGCGNIAGRYAESIVAADGIELVAATDALPKRAEELIARFGGTAHGSLDALLADPSVDAVVNLTGAVAHVAVTRAALEAGKHVHSEKPLALRHDEAHALVDLADQRGLGLSSSPATLLGEAQQTMWKLVRDGAIGTVRVAYAEANWGRIESWHPDPTTIHAAGAMADVGVYPIAILTAMFGPARSATAYATTIAPDRVDLRGAPFSIETPDFIVAVLELESGVVVRVTASFYVGASYQRGIELHGDDGILHLPAWSDFSSRLLLSTTGDADDYAEVDLLRPGYPGTDWSRPIVDLAAAIDEGRRPRASGEQAAHVVEILDAIDRSRRDGGPVAIESSFTRPAPLPWAAGEGER